jgi:hypothetical protein
MGRGKHTEKGDEDMPRDNIPIRAEQAEAENIIESAAKMGQDINAYMLRRSRSGGGAGGDH